MAIKIEFQGFINEVKHFDWGTVYNVSHNQVRKNAAGEWETVGKDFFSVVAPDDARNLTENTRVNVKGRFKTKRFDKRDGSKGISLEVRTDSIEVLSAGDAPKVGHAALNEVWEVKEVPDAQVPF